MLPKVYIIILNYKSWPDTIECLESLFKLDYPNYQVVVVDNHSPNDSVRRIQQWASGEIEVSVTADNPLKPFITPPFPKPVPMHTFKRSALDAPAVPPAEASLVLIDAEENNGYSSGNNVGIRYARQQGDGAFLWILNNDVVVAPDSLRHLVDRMLDYRRADRKVGIAGCKVMHYHQPGIIQCASGSHLNKWLGRLSTGLGNGQPDQGQFDVEEVDVDFVTGSCMFASAAFVEAVGPLAEEYFLYYEEPDWAERGKRKGDWELGYAWKSKVYHKEGASTGGGTHRRKSVSLLSDFYFVRSRVLYTRKFNPRYLPTVYLGLLLAITSRAWHGQWNRALMILKVMLKPTRTFKASPRAGKG